MAEESKKGFFQRLFSRKEDSQITHDPFPKKESEIDTEIQNIQKMLDEKEMQKDSPMQISDLKHDPLEEVELKRKRDPLEDFDLSVKHDPLEEAVLKEEPLSPRLEAPQEDEHIMQEEEPERLEIPADIKESVEQIHASLEKEAIEEPIIVPDAPKLSKEEEAVELVLSREKKGRLILNEKRKVEREKALIEAQKKKIKKDLSSVALQKKELKATGLSIKKNKSALDKEEIAITKKIKQLEAIQASIDTKQKNIAPRLSELEDNEKSMAERVAKLDKREEEISKKESDIRENQRLLTQKEQDILKDLDSIEKDKVMISLKEKEIEGIFRKIEKGHEMLLKKDTAARDRIEKALAYEAKVKDVKEDLERRDKEVVARERAVLEKEKKAQAMMLEAKSHQMKKEAVKKLEATAKKLQEKIKDEFQKLQHTYNKRVMIEKGEHTEVVKTEEGKPEEITEGNVRDYVEETSQLIQKGMYVEANRNIASLISKHHTLSEGSAYKKELYYDILRLKHELKLALLK